MYTGTSRDPVSCTRKFHITRGVPGGREGGRAPLCARRAVSGVPCRSAQPPDGARPPEIRIRVDRPKTRRRHTIRRRRRKANTGAFNDPKKKRKKFSDRFTWKNGGKRNEIILSSYACTPLKSLG